MHMGFRIPESKQGVNQSQELGVTRPHDQQFLFVGIEKLIVRVVETEGAVQKGINVFHGLLGTLCAIAFRAHGGCGQLILQVKY
jgi:hypothetical protein